MFQCPRCQASLPPTSARCQFCGTDLSRVARPMSAQFVQQQKRYYGETAQWKIICGHVIAALWIANGAFTALAGVLFSTAGETIASDPSSEFGKSAAAVGGAFSGVGFCLGIFGVFYIFLGLGMILRWAWVPVWVYILSGLSILGNGGMLIQGTGDTAATISRVISLSLAVFAIYIMYETRDEY